MTPERARFNEFWIMRFAEFIPIGALIYDIGKSPVWDYGKILVGRNVRTIDRDASACPDIVCDVEREGVLHLSGAADGVICIGVSEECSNPFKMIGGVATLIKDGGVAMFGIMSIGYPYASNRKDNLRFTPAGARTLLSANFDEIESEDFKRASYCDPSYIFYIGRKK